MAGGAEEGGFRSKEETTGLEPPLKEFGWFDEEESDELLVPNREKLMALGLGASAGVDSIADFHAANFSLLLCFVSSEVADFQIKWMEN